MKILALLKLIEDGYDINYLLCNECVEGGCDIGCECRCHILAIEKKRKGRQALVELFQKRGYVNAKM